jgi:hypothetical protein
VLSNFTLLILLVVRVLRLAATAINTRFYTKHDWHANKDNEQKNVLDLNLSGCRATDKGKFIGGRRFTLVETHVNHNRNN